MTFPPLCDTCGWQHLNSCDDAADERQLWQVINERFAEALVTGNGTGQIVGFLAMADAPEPTPVERALAILAPHLRREPLYRPTV